MTHNKSISIGIIGSSESNPDLDNLAQETGKRLAEAGITVICGGLGGVMEAACRGAKSADGLTIGILPGTSKDTANPYVDIPIPTGINDARNLIIIRSCSALIAIGGKYGTLSEIAFALRLKVPVVGLCTWELEKISKEQNNIIPAKSPEEAVKKVIELSKL